MTMMTQRWYDQRGNGPAYLLNQYKKPEAWFKRSIDFPDRTFQCELYKVDCIRAAVIMDRTANYRDLLTVPWSMLIWVPGENYVLIMGSMADPQAWIDQARRLGARAWYLTAADRVFRWDPGVPRISAEDIDSQDQRSTEIYNAAAVEQELLSGQYTDLEVAARHRLGRVTIYRIRRRLGLPTDRARNRRTQSLATEY